ncbi:MAG: phytanoyl-CoA dioxygenase [Saprospiraceae bacterium]
MSEIARTLLGADTEFLAINGAIKQFFELLMDITGIEPGNDVHREHLILPSGKCIGPYWAAMCVKDLLRTKKFVHGLYLGIRAAQQKFPDTTIQVLYAGTGPFATLALPMTALFSPDEVQFTLLEIQPESVRMLHKVIEAFQIDAYIQDIVQGDAMQYQCDPARRAHVLLSETMQNGLRNEPQVAITLNLVPQIQPGGILIPAQVQVWAGLLNKKIRMAKMLRPDETHEPAYLLKKAVFTLDNRSPDGVPDNPWFAPVEIQISPKESARYPHFCLFTEIQVYGNVIISPYESHLTLPCELLHFERMQAPPERVELQYYLNDPPGFRVKQPIAA